MVHPCGLSLATKEKVYAKRKVDKKTWEEIASEVWNLGKRPYWKVVRAAFRELSTSSRAVKKSSYDKCGRKAVLTDELIKWLVEKMLVLRATCQDRLHFHRSPAMLGAGEACDSGGLHHQASPQQQRLLTIFLARRSPKV